MEFSVVTVESGGVDSMMIGSLAWLNALALILMDERVAFAWDALSLSGDLAAGFFAVAAAVAWFVNFIFKTKRSTRLHF